MARDFWNNPAPVDEEALAAEIIEIIKSLGTLSYSEMQELRNASELCDRGHFEYQVAALAKKAGVKVPAGLAVVMEDPDFDVRTSFMKAVVTAIDPAPTMK